MTDLELEEEKLYQLHLSGHLSFSDYMDACCELAAADEERREEEDDRGDW